MSEGWQVEVCDAEEGCVLRYVFAELPITLGRHEGNDVRLPRSFVSGFHARIERGPAGLSVLDVSRTNGIRVRRGGGEEARVDPQRPQALSCCNDEFFIGSYRISVHGAPVPSAPPGSAELSLPALSVRSEQPGELDSSLPSLPGSRGREPRLAEAASAATERRALEATALAALEELASVLAPGQRLDTPERVSDLIRRLQLSLELCCRGVVRLRESQRRCASALRLPRLTADDPLPAESAEQLSRRLLDGRLPVARLRSGLMAEFQSLARHQVGMLDGMIEGTAALLAELAPERIEASAERQQGRGWLPVGKLRSLRRAYREQHARLSRRDGVLSLLFGRAFRDAYAAYLGREPGHAGQVSARRRRQLR